MEFEFLKNREDLGNIDIAKEWRVILTSQEIEKCVQKCADYINNNFKGKKIIMTCILKGAVYFLADLTRKLIIPHSCYFIESSSYKDKQVQDEKVEILSKIIPSKFADREVILIDELFDNGTTLNYVKNAIHEQGNVPLDKIFTCTLFKKSRDYSLTCTNNNTDIQCAKSPDLIGIEVPDIWLVGYGLDDCQEKRGWTYLFACPKAPDVSKTKDDIIFENDEIYKQMRIKILSEIPK